MDKETGNDNILITSFLATFEIKLDRCRNNIKTKIAQAKAENRKVDKAWLKRELKIAKDLRKVVKQMNDAIQNEVLCPHCNKTFMHKKK